MRKTNAVKFEPIASPMYAQCDLSDFDGSPWTREIRSAIAHMCKGLFIWVKEEETFYILAEVEDSRYRFGWLNIDICDHMLRKLRVDGVLKEQHERSFLELFENPLEDYVWLLLDKRVKVVNEIPKHLKGAEWFEPVAQKENSEKPKNNKKADVFGKWR